MTLTQVVTKSNRKFRPFIIRSRDLWITSCHVTALERCHKVGVLPVTTHTLIYYTLMKHIQIT